MIHYRKVEYKAMTEQDQIQENTISWVPAEKYLEEKRKIWRNKFSFWEKFVAYSKWKIASIWAAIIGVAGPTEKVLIRGFISELQTYENKLLSLQKENKLLKEEIETYEKSLP